jgi:hypothetical protein
VIEDLAIEAGESDVGDALHLDPVGTAFAQGFHRLDEESPHANDGVVLWKRR